MYGLVSDNVVVQCDSQQRFGRLWARAGMSDTRGSRPRVDKLLIQTDRGVSLAEASRRINCPLVGGDGWRSQEDGVPMA